MFGKLFWAAFLGAGLAIGGGAEAASNAMKAMSFNLRYSTDSADQGSWKQWDSTNHAPQRREFVVRLLTNRAPDVAGFQEGLDTQLDYLAANLPSRYRIERQRPSGGSGAENAAFLWDTNKLELLDRGAFSLGPSPGGGYWNNPPGSNYEPGVFFPDMGLPFPRIALWGRFRWRATGQEFLFYTTHFDFNSTPQVGSARLIADDARTRNARMPLSPLAIVVGDFNSTQTDNDWKLFTGAYSSNGITGDFTDGWYQARGTWTDSGTIHGFAGGTQPASKRIDWILHRGGFTATQAVIVTDTTISTALTPYATSTMYPSDHYPVYAMLRFPDPRADTDADGLPDATELSASNTLPADPDTDNDLLLDGQEDLNGNGALDGGETGAASPGDTQLPTDIRHHQMDGIRDRLSALWAANGMELYGRFDGRYLYVATQDAGEGNDHFIFVSRDPNDAVPAPWAKAGQVARWSAFLADENDSRFAGWFDASKAPITNLFTARAAVYYENGGRLEGVLDLAQIFGAGFTNAFYLAVAPYASADGGALYAPAQAPAGNGDGDILGAGEYYRLNPGDLDRDGINDYADPDRDGDGLPNAWEAAYGLDADSTNGQEGADGDPDGDGISNLGEFRSCTSPVSSQSVFTVGPARITEAALEFRWLAAQGKTCRVYRAAAAAFSNNLLWSCVHTGCPVGGIVVTGAWTDSVTGDAAFYRLGLSP